MKKIVEIDELKKQADIRYLMDSFPSLETYKKTLDEFIIAKALILKSACCGFSVWMHIDVKDKKGDREETVKIIKFALGLLSESDKKRLYINNVTIDFSPLTLNFRIDEVFLPILKPAKKRIIKTMAIFGISLKVNWIDQPDIEAREKKESEMNKEIERYQKMTFKPPVRTNYTSKKAYSGKRWGKDAGEVSIKELRGLGKGTTVTILGEVSAIQTRKFTNLILEDKNGDLVEIKTYQEQQSKALAALKEGMSVYIKGSIKIDGEALFLWFNSVQITEQAVSKDDIEESSESRFELHAHTKMSEYDGVSDVNDYYTRLKKLGHNGLAITDHNCIQAFSEAAMIQKKDKDFKFLFGCEFTTLVDDRQEALNTSWTLEECDYLVIDIETTGLYPMFDEILEVSIRHIKYPVSINGEELHFFIKPNIQPTNESLEFTGITNEDLESGITKSQAVNKILSFIKKYEKPVFVAHNANFDHKFVTSLISQEGLEIPKMCVLDTIALSRLLIDKQRAFALGKVARNLNVEYDTVNAHRADYDTDVLGKILIKLLNLYQDGEFLNSIKSLIKSIHTNITTLEKRHINVLCKNEKSKKYLYTLISESRTKYLHYGPNIPLTSIFKYREHFLIGSGCWDGLIFSAVLNNDIQELRSRMKDFDYIEIQPIDCYSHLETGNHITSESIAKAIRLVVSEALKQNMLVVATSDSHYANEKDKIVRDIYINAEGLKGSRHPFYRSLKTRLAKNKIVVDGPTQHYRSTTEMLKDMDFLSDLIDIKDLVINNTKKIAGMCESFNIQPTKLFSPSAKNINLEAWAKEKIKNKQIEIYGYADKFVEKRINDELDNLIKNNYLYIYYMSSLLVEEIKKRGALVGSRGSVGSSIVAFFLGVSEVNPLPPHYYCKDCKIIEFENEFEDSGNDLLIKMCTNCGIPYKTDGMNIPFETFLGLDGDKVPDIDLNLPKELLKDGHDFIRSKIGRDKVFRAGTISTVARNTAFAIIKKYNAHLPPEQVMSSMRINQLIPKMIDVKRTTGMHPGGLIVIPEDKDVNEFTPYQYPADKSEDDWYTTHYNFNFLHDNLLKLDFLGHGDPSSLRMLDRLTNNASNKINFNDKEIVRLFWDCSVLNLNPNDIAGETTGSIALPEFGTKLTRSITSSIKPKSFADLVRVSGISHGENVWKNNIQKLILLGHKMKDLVTCRDDIMLYLLKHGVNHKISFDIMERVRKGIELSNEQIKLMNKHEVPAFYIEMCKKISYLFPKAHAVAYVYMAYRMAYFKMHYPLEFYATYFTSKSKNFPALFAAYSHKVLNEQYLRINSLGGKVKKPQDKKEIEMLTDIEVLLEIKARGIEILSPDINIADNKEFLILKEKNAIMYPFSGLEGFGEKNAKIVVERKENGPYTSIENFRKRTKVNEKQFKELEKFDCFPSLSKINL